MNLPRPFAKLSGDRQADTGGTLPRCDTRRASACSVFGVGMESISAKQRKWFSASRSFSFAATLYFYTPRMRFHAVAVFAVLLSIARADPGIATHFDLRFPLAGKALLKPLTPRKRRAPPSRYYLSLSSRTLFPGARAGLHGYTPSLIADLQAD